MDENGDVWQHVIVLLLAIGVALTIGAATLLVQPWLVSLSQPLVPTYIFH